MRSGGFTIWPGSPQLLYHTMQQDRNFTPTEDFAPAFQHIKDTITPIEFSGGVGDVILYHHLAVRTIDSRLLPRTESDSQMFYTSSLKQIYIRSIR